MAALPNLIVIGGMKCGTSSLHHYLGLHPEIRMAPNKELNHFLAAEPQPPAEAGALDRELMREDSRRAPDRGAYERNFAPAPVRGETSVAYSFPWYPGTARAIAETLGEVRIVFVAREPVARMLSHHAQFATRDRRPAPEALLAPGNPYLEASRYATALEPYLEQFGRERIALVRQDELRDRRRETLARIFRFLGVAEDFDSDGFDVERNVTAVKGRAYRLAEFARTGAGPVSAALARVPTALRARGERLLARRGQRGSSDLSPDDVWRIRAELEPELARLEALSGWDLRAWRES